MEKKIKHVIYKTNDGLCEVRGLNSDVYAAIMYGSVAKVGTTDAIGWGSDFGKDCIEWRIGQYAWTFITPSWVRAAEDLKGLM